MSRATSLKEAMSARKTKSRPRGPGFLFWAFDKKMPTRFSSNFQSGALVFFVKSFFVLALNKPFDFRVEAHKYHNRK